MTQFKKRALWSLIIWGTALMAIVILFFSAGGPTTFLEGENKNILSRVFITVGFISYFAMLILTRSRIRGDQLVKDERDELITRRSYSISFHTLLVYIFLLSSFIYGYYKGIHEIKLIPAGWVWFLAISSFLVGFISNAVSYLIMDARMSGHGQS